MIGLLKHLLTSGHDTMYFLLYYCSHRFISLSSVSSYHYCLIYRVGSSPTALCPYLKSFQLASKSKFHTIGQFVPQKYMGGLKLRNIALVSKINNKQPQETHVCIYLLTSLYQQTQMHRCFKSHFINFFRQKVYSRSSNNRTWCTGVLYISQIYNVKFVNNNTLPWAINTCLCL